MEFLSVLLALMPVFIGVALIVIASVVIVHFSEPVARLRFKVRLMYFAQDALFYGWLRWHRNHGKDGVSVFATCRLWKLWDWLDPRRRHGYSEVFGVDCDNCLRALEAIEFYDHERHGL